MTELEFVIAELTVLGFERDGELPDGRVRLKLRDRNLYAAVGSLSVQVYKKLPNGRPTGKFTKFLLYQRRPMKDYISKVIATLDSNE